MNKDLEFVITNMMNIGIEVASLKEGHRNVKNQLQGVIEEQKKLDKGLVNTEKHVINIKNALERYSDQEQSDKEKRGRYPIWIKLAIGAIVSIATLIGILHQIGVI